MSDICLKMVSAPVQLYITTKIENSSYDDSQVCTNLYKGQNHLTEVEYRKVSLRGEKNS